MAVRIKSRQEHSLVALVVITFLGLTALLGTASSAFLIHEALVYEGTIDAAVVALIGQMVSIATLTIGALGAMLSSTSPRPAAPPMLPDGSTPATIVNDRSNPVETHPQPPAVVAPVDPDPVPEEEPVGDPGDDEDVPPLLDPPLPAVPVKSTRRTRAPR